MNEKIIFVRTSSGEDEVLNRTAHLSKDIKRALLMVDGTASVAEIMKRSSPSLRGMLEDMFLELARGGFIQDKTRSAQAPKLVTPQVLPAAQKKQVNEVDELDFTAAYRAPTPAVLAEEATRAAAKSLAAIEEAARLKIEQEAARILAEQKAKADEARAKAEASAKAQLAAETARMQAEHLAERRKAEQEAAKLQAEAVAREQHHAKELFASARKAELQSAELKARAAAQEKARLEAEIARAEARAQAEEQARVAAEAARLQAERLATEERLKAEQEVVRARMETERLARETNARIKAEQEAAVRAEAERHAQELAASARKNEEHAARARAEKEARAKLEAELSELKAQAENETKARALAEKHAEKIKAEAEARALAVANEKASLEAEVAKLKTQAETEALARAEAAKARQDAERLSREAEAARIKAEQDARRIREAAEHTAALAKLEAARIQAEHEAAKIQALAAEQARLEAARVQAELIAQETAARLRAEQEAAQLKIEQEAARIKAEQEIARIKAEQEAAVIQSEKEAVQIRSAANQNTDEDMLFSALDVLTKSATATDNKSVTPETNTPAPFTERRKTTAAVTGCDSRGGNNGIPVVERRTTTAAVLFFDIVGYTKQSDRRQIELKQQFNQLVTDSFASLDTGERIILDTGDGAAIGFLQHPTDALESSRHFLAQLSTHNHLDYPDLRVRIGIHLGPVSLVKDMNGQINMLGDGINTAQRVMSFAGHDQLYISRAYFEFISNLSEEYNDIFRYRGAQQDKHGREHQVYELLETVENLPVQTPSETVSAFDFGAFDIALAEPEVQAPQTQEPKINAAEQLLMDASDIGQFLQPVITPAPPIPPATEVQTEEVSTPQYSEAETRQLADVQAKKWAEAEQRELEASRKKAQSTPIQALPPTVQSAQKTTPKAAPKPARKKISLIKLASGLLIILLAAILILPAILPTQNDISRIEHKLSTAFQQPVHIGQLTARILPTPRVVLTDITLGEKKDIQVHQAQINFSFSALFSELKPIASLDLEKIQFNGSTLLPASAWLQKLAADSQYPVAKINLTQGTLDTEGLQFSNINGELDFDPSGEFTLAKLNANDHKLSVEIHAKPEQGFSLTLRDGALPLFPHWVFDELNASGELSREELIIKDIDARIRGGTLSGDARINWRNGWRVQGELIAKVIPLQNINKLLNGDMDGTARFQMQSASLNKLADTAVLNGIFNARKGVINGVDIIETTRLRSRESLPGGRTHFDELGGELSFANNIYHFSQLRINDSVIKASGALTMSGQQLSGNLLADLKLHAGSGTTTLQIGGSSESPTLRLAH